MLSALKKIDKNPLIAKKQQAVAKALTTWKQRNALQDAHELAWYLLAAGRDRAARSIVDEIAVNVPTSANQRVWYSAAHAICLAARLARLAKAAKRSNELIARLLENPPYHESAPRAFYMDEIRRNVEQLDAAASERPATACEYAANSLTNFVLFAETVRHGGFPYDGLFTTKQLETAIANGTSLLRERLVTR